jgi:hypothetical protein
MSQKSLDWVRSVSGQLRDDESKALRIERSGYVAFVRHDDGYHFEVIDRHYDEEEWASRELSQTQLLGTAARFSHQAEIVEMPDLDEVAVTLDEAEGGESA